MKVYDMNMKGIYHLKKLLKSTKKECVAA